MFDVNVDRVLEQSLPVEDPLVDEADELVELEAAILPDLSLSHSFD